MTRQEQLLVILMEECAEVSQRASKALRFGLTDPAGTEPGQPYTNQDRLLVEINDLLAILDMMFKSRGTYNSPMLQQDKKEKVEKYLKLSEKLGTLK
tara:strand:- start:194 stop:484 length:291 start_codon:yes stop_codon:yes gene_type:complete